MNFYKSIIIFIILIYSQFTIIYAEEPPKKLQWKIIENGLYLSEIKAPRITRIGDSKITILKIDPKYFDFQLVAATEMDSMQRTVKEWCELKGMIAAINAGMYGGVNKITNVGYMKNFNHINNPDFKESYKAIAAFNPIDQSLQAFKIIDTEYESWENYKDKYQSFSQSMRMINSKTEPMLWKQKHKMRSSMVVLGVDKKGNVLFIFSRSPYTPNEFSKILLKAPIQIQTAMYLEGGPESSLYLNNGNIVIEKIGSYVSRTFAHDKNQQFRKMPNVIGIMRK